MYWTGYAVDGIYLNLNELDMLRQIYETEHEGVSEEEWDDLILIERELDLGTAHLNIVCVEDDCCDGLTLYPYGTEPRGPVVLWEGVIVEAEHQPSAFSAAYPSIEAMKQEFVEKLGKYLPEDFDWESRMGHFQYACFA